MEIRFFQEIVEESWRWLDDALAGMDDAALSEPGVVESWSVRDLIGHVTAWEQLALHHIRTYRAGEVVGAGAPEVDAYNAAEAQRRAGLSLEALRAEHAEVRAELAASLAGLGDADWDTVVGEGERAWTLSRWIGGTLGGPLGPGTHAAEHARHILLWRLGRSA